MGRDKHLQHAAGEILLADQWFHAVHTCASRPPGFLRTLKLSPSSQTSTLPRAVSKLSAASAYNAVPRSLLAVPSRHFSRPPRPSLHFGFRSQYAISPLPFPVTYEAGYSERACTPRPCARAGARRSGADVNGTERLHRSGGVHAMFESLGCRCVFYLRFRIPLFQPAHDVWQIPEWVRKRRRSSLRPGILFLGRRSIRGRTTRTMSRAVSNSIRPRRICSS